MASWEYLVVKVDSPYVDELEGQLHGPPADELLWETFLARRLTEGWLLVSTDRIDRRGIFEEYTLKRVTGIPSNADADLPERQATVLRVRLELSTSCAGAYWTPTLTNGVSMYRAGVMDNAEYYNRLGACGWELRSVHNISGPGAYYPDEPPREAIFERHS